MGKDLGCTHLRKSLIALALADCPLPIDRQRRALEVVREKLLTPYGLRTLSPDHPDYRGRYEGDWGTRDEAYHQGTVWPWLLGHFAEAHYRVYRDRRFIRHLLSPFREHLKEAGVGSISEVFDGDPPHNPGGCIAQAWSVAELLRVAAIGHRK